ncbi:MAG: DedA family protein [Sarcina sp.]
MYYLKDFVAWIMHLAMHYGYTGIFVASGIEYSALPAPPSEVIIPLVGAMAGAGKFNIFIAFLVTVIAGVVGSTITYYVGYFWGRKVVDFVERKIPKSKKPLHKVNVLFTKYSHLSIYLARVLPFTRSYISIVAGIEKVNIFSFWIFTALGIGTWNAILIAFGYFIGSDIGIIKIYAEKYIYVIAIVVVILISTYLIYRYFKKKNR